MSGHSHAKTILHQKQITDAKRGKIFSKLGRLISIAAKEGADPERNSKLRQALEEAKKFNMPKDNIERAIKKGIGGTNGEKLTEVIYEALGPGGVSIIIEGITDNKNRTLSEIKQILQKRNGKLAGEGSVKWMFRRKGLITVNLANQLPEISSGEELGVAAIEMGAEDVSFDEKENILYIYTNPQELEAIKIKLRNKKINIESFGLEWIAKEEIQVLGKDKENLDKLFDELDDNEAVQGIYSNAQN